MFGRLFCDQMFQDRPLCHTIYRTSLSTIFGHIEFRLRRNLIREDEDTYTHAFTIHTRTYSLSLQPKSSSLRLLTKEHIDACSVCLQLDIVVYLYYILDLLYYLCVATSAAMME